MDDYISKSELISRLHQGFARFNALLNRLTPAQKVQPNTIGDWSIQDIVAHFICHEQRALDELACALRGETYHGFPADNDSFNAGGVLTLRFLPFDEVHALWTRSFQQVVAAVDALSESDFDPTGRVVQLLDDSIDGALANNSYEHYEEHAVQIEVWLAE